MIDLKALQSGQTVEGQLAVRSKDEKGEGLREYSNKPGKFFVISVGNQTGNITLKYWGGRNPENATSIFTSLNVGDIIMVKGQCTDDSYSKGLVISVNEDVNYGSSQGVLKKTETKDSNLDEFIPALNNDTIETLFSDLTELIEMVEHPHLKELLKRFFNQTEFVEVFKKTPAAKRNHHNYLGGLLEHTVNVTRLCKTISGFYNLDRDLLIAGALLHDIGKTREYSLKASIDVTDEGRFIGHLPLTAEIVSREIEEIPDFPDTLKYRLVHMVISHHGMLEFGSPKVPAFPEAVALFHADYMDAFVKNTLQELESIPEGESWTYSNSLKRFLHKTKGD